MMTDIESREPSADILAERLARHLDPIDRPPRFEDLENIINARPLAVIEFLLDQIED